MLLELTTASGGAFYLARRHKHQQRLIQRLQSVSTPNWRTLKAQAGVLSEEEQAANRYLQRTSIILACGVTSLLTYPALLYLLIPPMLYTAIPLYRDAWRDLTQKRQVTAVVVDVLLAVLSSAYTVINPSILVAMTFGGWLYSLILKLIASSKSHHQDLLQQFTVPLPAKLWVVKEGVELETPTDQIQIGDIVIINRDEPLPFDGLVRSQTVLVDESILTGDKMLQSKAYGDSVFAGSLVKSDRLLLQVTTKAEQTALANLRATLTQHQVAAVDQDVRGKMLADRYALPGVGLAALAYPFKGMQGLLSVLLLTPFYNMRLLGLLTIDHYLQAGSHEGLLIKNGRTLENIYRLDGLVINLSACQAHAIATEDLHTALQTLQQRGLTLWVLVDDPQALPATWQSLPNTHCLTIPAMTDQIQFIQQQQIQGKQVGYVGDGIQDIALMQAANISISVNGLGSLAQDKAQIILLENHLQPLLNLFTLSQRFEASMLRNLLATTVPNIIGILAVFGGSMSFMAALGVYYAGLGLGLSNVFWPQLRRHTQALLASQTASPRQKEAEKQ